MFTVQLNNVTKSFSDLDMEHSMQTGRKRFAPWQKEAQAPGPKDRDNALTDITLTIHRGETVSVIGPSGCGKTTLLRVIAGLIAPTSGEVLYDGEPIDNIPMADRGIGIVFQDYSLVPHMIAYDNIGFYDILRGKREKIPERIEHIASVMNVEIKYLLRRKPPQLSGGERQRVAIAHCLARDPKLFLFDEPLSNVDAKLRVSVRSKIKRLLQHYRITSVYVTHDQTEAITLSDRIVVMNGGRIEQTGAYQRLYEAPANVFVAGFLGTPPMNLFDGRIQDQAWHGSDFALKPMPHSLGDGKEAWLGIRPEHIKVETGDLSALVENVEIHYSERMQLLALRIGSTAFTVRVDMDSPVRIGDTIPLHFPTEQLMMFDKASGKRLGA